mmetsp:Transcript_21515/g.63013  ORF Transcript_21515/g.63013 Transcript_21515/m.63013 type:complete len:243 (-) Transcript_21515:272-1000(-)
MCFTVLHRTFLAKVIWNGLRVHRAPAWAKYSYSWLCMNSRHQLGHSSGGTSSFRSQPNRTTRSGGLMPFTESDSGSTDMWGMKTSPRAKAAIILSTCAGESQSMCMMGRWTVSGEATLWCCPPGVDVPEASLLPVPLADDRPPPGVRAWPSWKSDPAGRELSPSSERAEWDMDMPPGPGLALLPPPPSPFWPLEARAPPFSPPPASQPLLSVLLTYLYCRSWSSLKSKAVCLVTVSGWPSVE